MILLLLACADDPAVTWNADVRPLTDAHCASCHTAGGTAPFTFDSWENVEPVGAAMVDAVQTRRMPPWGYDPSCRDVADSLWLDDTQIATFTAWAAAGYPEGDEADYVPGETHDEPVLRDPDVELSIPTPYTPNDDQEDDYRCVLLDHTFEADTYVVGSDVVPDAEDLVHHVLTYAIPQDGIDAILALDAADPDEGYSCFGDVGLDNVTTVGGWVPGANPPQLMQDSAIRVAAGSRLVMQMHYNVSTAVPRPDQTTFQMWITQDEPDWLMVTYPLYQDELDIQPNDGDSTQTVTTRVPADGYIVSSSPHMHTRGRRIETTLTRTDGTTECLSDVDYDFDWQRSYDYLEPVPVSIEDRIDLTCVYDNSGTDEIITWGDGTNDEMCLDYLALMVPNTTGGQDGVCAGASDCAEACDGDAYCVQSCMTGASESCLYCGIEGLYGDCTMDACWGTVMPLWSCLEDCGSEGAYFDCTYDACRDEYEAYFECAWPLARDGVCAEDYLACDGLLPQE